ncbi:response regulator [uncultured Desulfuromonas sp.]|uniref:response regulator n=1 Tax=uncultured Desulfuromonas sp. TaxID=181013 RepID=UPI002636CEE0|nr:response regulator [uncultured Desulfuromonas sp.]
MTRRKRIGQILVETGTISAEALTRALKRQENFGGLLGQILEEMGTVSERDIAAVLARQFNFQIVRDIAKHSFSPELLGLLDSETAIKKLIFPLRQQGKTLYLAMADPLDMETLDDLSFRTGMRVIPCVTTAGEIQEAVNRHYLQVGSGLKPAWWMVLVVDDHELVRAAAIAALEKEGFHAIEAANGAEGLKAAYEHLPHLIISDTIMPRMDGYDMFRALKANSRTCSIPVIALSSRSAAEEEAKLLEKGYFDFVAKPINPVRLMARVKRALKSVYGDSPPFR